MDGLSAVPSWKRVGQGESSQPYPAPLRPPVPFE